VRGILWWKVSKLEAPPITAGDIYLLFYSFPFDFGAGLPIGIGPAVFLDSTPQEILDEADPPALADFVLPGYNLPGTGLVQCCLRKPVSSALPNGMTAANALFLSIAAIRLAAPFGIEIAGQFELSGGDDRIASPSLYNLRSVWQPGSGQEYVYSGALIMAADTIARRTAAVRSGRRLMSAYVLFSQVTIGMVSSLQLATMGLFAALEALFVPKGNYARTLGSRVASFLSRLPFPVNIEKWLEDEYIRRRSKLAHGIQDVLPWRAQSVEAEKFLAFGRLHELVRLSILGFLSLTDGILHEHSTQNGTRLQKLIDSLTPGNGPYLEGQRAWCE